MRGLVSLRLAAVCVACYVTFNATNLAAATYWSIGSYSDQRNALNEAARIQPELSSAVIIQSPGSGNTNYRLLIAADDLSVKPSLERLGIKGVWSVTFNGDLAKEQVLRTTNDIARSTETQADTTVKPNINGSTSWGVAGSFDDQENAVQLEAQLADHFEQVSVKEFLIDGRTLYRVLVGPMNDPTSARKMQLSEVDLSALWILRAEVQSTALTPVHIAPNGPNMAPDGRNIALPTIGDTTGAGTRALPANSRVLPTSGIKNDEYNLARLGVKDPPLITENKSNGRWSSEVGFESRVFRDPGLLNLERHHAAMSFQAEYYQTWNNGDDIFAFVPFARIDAQDNERTHFDIRELTWVHVADNFELRSGIRKVFWGVTESQHLVDIINQTDTVENPDGEEKLGQPMINLSLLRDWGVFDLYWLIGFRERKFSGPEGRPAYPFEISTDHSEYESSAEARRSDFAVRWVQSIGELELGISHFSGTSREPRLVPQFILQNNLPVSVILIPYYDVIEQTGLDAQFFLGDWAFKLEAISRSGQGNRFAAATVGFEKTFVGFAGGRGDLGVIAEYLFDERGAEGPAIGQDDIALGLRYAFNDAANTTALLVGLIDRASHEYITTFEASSRLGERLKLTVEASVINNTRNIPMGFPGLVEVQADPNADLAFLQDEDFIKFELIWYL
jgi:hypothetical protein